MKLTTASGPVHVNPLHVVSVREYDPGCKLSNHPFVTEVQISTRLCYYVLETVDEVVAQISTMRPSTFQRDLADAVRTFPSELPQK